MFIQNLFRHWTYRFFAPGVLIREKYEAFRGVLEADSRAHELLADIEEIYISRSPVDISRVEKLCRELSFAVESMVDGLIRISPLENLTLREIYRKINFYLELRIAPPEHPFFPPFVVLLDRPLEGSAALVGGKATNIARVSNELGLPVPRGFAVTTRAFYYFLEFNDLKEPIKKALSGLDLSSSASLEAVSNEILRLIRGAVVPPAVEEEILSAHDIFWGEDVDGEKPFSLAVRSSAVGEDGDLTFAGQFTSVMGVGRDALIDAYKEVLASKYSPRAIDYRVRNGLLDSDTPMAVLVQEVIPAQVSGVLYTRDLAVPEADLSVIYAVTGLGETLVSGEVTPEVVSVSCRDGFEILSRKSGGRAGEIREGTHILDEGHIRILAGWGAQMESFFGRPQDVEWCLDCKGRLYVLQARPLDVEGRGRELFDRQTEDGDEEGALLLEGGETASAGRGCGPVFILDRDSEIGMVPAGAVLVARYGRPHYTTALDRIAAIVTEQGSRAGHLASVAREYATPFLAGLEGATKRLVPGMVVTVDATRRRVTEGCLMAASPSPPAKRDNVFEKSPFRRLLKGVYDIVSPLRLVDPASPRFVAEECRSLHDLIRYVHEKAVGTMFMVGGAKGGSSKGAKKIVSDLPILLYLLDVGGALTPVSKDSAQVTPGDFVSYPLRAFWKGLTDPGVHWSGMAHFNWSDFGDAVAGGGVVSPDSPGLASYMVASDDYLNAHIRFGYHFSIVDALCGENEGLNYCNFRFVGGGGRPEGRGLRALFLQGVLEALGFLVSVKGDLVDARLREMERDELARRLTSLGRLLGATRLMDMQLSSIDQIPGLVSDFLAGRSRFDLEAQGRDG